MSLNEASLDGVRPLGARIELAGNRASRIHGWRRLAGQLEMVLDAERGRWFLWLPVFFGGGIALYLSLLTEPPLSLGLAAALAAFAALIFMPRSSGNLIACSAALMMALGFLAAKANALMVAAPSLERTLRFTTVDGWIDRLEPQEKRVRLVLRVIAIERLAKEVTPRLVKVSIHGNGAGLSPGDPVRLRATLMPLSDPALPGGFDFARHFWFQGIGGSGYGMGKIEPLPSAPQAPWDLRLRAAVAKFRHTIEGRIGSVIQGDRGAIAKALIVGAGGEMTEGVQHALRDAGLAHIISISGLHMALTAGAMFWLARALLALFPSVALRYPVKTWAAVAAIGIAGAYLALSGAAVAAVRSFIMITVMFTAVILNRPALSLRNLAISALLILLVMPQSLVDAGFQMSFAATAALIAFYETRPAIQMFAAWPRLYAVPLLMVIDAAATTFFASLAVDPLAAYHFHRIALYSMLGNVLAVPAVSFVVMPMVLMTLMALPFGVEAAPLMVMDLGIGWMISIAHFTADLPGAVIATPAFADGALTLMVAGGLWLIVWRQSWRWMGLVPIAAGLALAPAGERPDIWVDREGKLIAVRDKDGLIATPNSRAAGFSLERWMEGDGDSRTPKEARASRIFQCDAASCLVMVKGKLISYALHPSALRDDCGRAAILIAQFPVSEPCTQPDVVIDSLDLREKGAHAMRVADGKVIVRTASDRRGDRPWIASYRRREKIPEVAPDRAAVTSQPGDSAPDSADPTNLQ
jgi:competence protein ComEC